ncbi:hypothetical protein I3843_14G040500 [Carya illinoinensis]|uniref:Uncharacterized protein n=1 Tax=Carya illinoinensis TaxID=32201 RepID=A0A8T1NGB0_CARIL|nr:hypothetical protein CIPAW_14G039400 [Carya illinoinensis]KAG7946474.1 hypothetical protein I3843_14G040500 [Carya illinoinensis]
MTGTPDTYMNASIIFPTHRASASFPPLELTKNLFPAITSVIIFKVRRSIHSLITTLAWFHCLVILYDKGMFRAKPDHEDGTMFVSHGRQGSGNWVLAADLMTVADNWPATCWFWGQHTLNCGTTAISYPP